MHKLAYIDGYKILKKLEKAIKYGKHLLSISFRNYNSIYITMRIKKKLENLSLCSSRNELNCNK